MARADRILNRTERLFALVLLLQTRPNMTSRDLAEHFSVSRRTIFRDLRALGESGVPLTYADAPALITDALVCRAMESGKPDCLWRTTM